MAVTDTIRPASVRKTGAATSVPSGTLSAVTSDNSDTTYINFPVASSGSNWSLRLGSHTPSSGYQRHRIRGRVRIRTDAGTCTEDIDLGRGSVDYIEFDHIPVTSSFVTQSGSWYQTADFGLDTAGALSDLNIGGGWLEDASGAASSRTAEAYVDIDCRFHPDYAPKILDNAGTDKSSGTVTDTNQPTLFFGAVAYDGLPPLDWSVTVVNGVSTVVASQSGSGTPPGSVPVGAGLADGAYTATFKVASSIRGADRFEYSVVKTFSVANVTPPPSPPLLTVTPSGGGYLLSWTYPGGQAWDSDYVVTEIWRTDCTGRSRIATIPDALSGSYLDLAVPQLDQVLSGVDCEMSTDNCDLTYEVRYFGYVSTYVQLPSTIPASLILGWPGSVASIPSGWTRVTALDGFYPKGASTTGTPSVTGGSATHFHTTPAHNHVIGTHGHFLGGNSGSSNASTTSARYNGASQPQANQPHTHSLPGATGLMSELGSDIASPNTSTVDNRPETREVIWIKSDGAQANYPVGILGWATESVSGWTTDSNSFGRFLRGAAAAGAGGAQNGAATHTHDLASHTHAGFNHVHPIGSTGLSNPLSNEEAGSGSGTPRWLPRHTHPMAVAFAQTGDLVAAAAGPSDAQPLDPPNRRLQVLRNTGGGTQTRIIGLYTGALSGLDPLLNVCNGNNGTPDMRGWFARDRGSSSINSTGGADTHSHTMPSHTHGIPSHQHGTFINASTTGSFLAPSSGDLGSSPTTGHTHGSPLTAGETPPVGGTSGGADPAVANNVPPFKEVHFVRLDGTISGGPLPVPQLKVSDYARTTVPSVAYGDGLDRLSSMDDRMAVVSDRSSDFPRLVVESVPIGGGLHSVSTTLPGEDLNLSIAVEGIEAIDRLERLLAADRVYWSPVGGVPGWFAPNGWRVSAPSPGVKVLQITMVRQPWPDTSEPEEYL